MQYIAFDVVFDASYELDISMEGRPARSAMSAGAERKLDATRDRTAGLKLADHNGLTFP